MSADNTKETEQLIIKLLRKLERKGKNVHSFLWQLMNQFEEQFDEKNDEKKQNTNSNKITLLYNETAPYVCKVGHEIFLTKQKHLSTEPCIECGHRNNDNKQYKTKPNHAQILKFLNAYNTSQVSFGPDPQLKSDIKQWITNGSNKQWPVHYAAILGDIRMIEQLCKNKNTNIDQEMSNWCDKRAITAAARYGQLESVIELIKYGANPIPRPDAANDTPYKMGVQWNHKAIIVFYKQYIKYLYNFDINSATNLECYKCYFFDLHFNKHIINETMAKYVYCRNCSVANVDKVKLQKVDNSIIESRIIKTLKENPSISVDTLCQMKDVKSLHTILKEIMVSGEKHTFSLWLLDIDNFKTINSHLTHAIADTKIQALGQVLKQLEPISWTKWRDDGYDGLFKVWAFRQGGDEFALVVDCNLQKINILQKLYEMIRDNISKIKLGKIKCANDSVMEHITVSIGVCLAERIDTFEEMMQEADKACETVKMGNKNGIAIYDSLKKAIYKNFQEIS